MTAALSCAHHADSLGAGGEATSTEEAQELPPSDLFLSCPQCTISFNATLNESRKTPRKCGTDLAFENNFQIHNIQTGEMGCNIAHADWNRQWLPSSTSDAPSRLRIKMPINHPLILPSEGMDSVVASTAIGPVGWTSGAIGGTPGTAGSTSSLRAATGMMRNLQRPNWLTHPPLGPLNC